MSARLRLSAKQLLAAQLVAEDLKTDTEIARSVGIGQRTLERWKHQPAFRAHVQTIIDGVQAQTAAEGIANKLNRIQVLQEDFDRLETVRVERGEDGNISHLPGASTGFVVRSWKQVGGGFTAKVVEEHGLDPLLINQRRGILRDVAREKGELSEKLDVSGELLVRRYVGVDPDKV